MLKEKINEFEWASTTIIGDYSTGGEHRLDTEKFAELVIQECISVIEPDDHPVDEINYRYAIISDIKNHFGID
jgi:hypothetical protein